MYDIPKSIVIEDKEFHIRNDGDYRMVLDCFNALEDMELTAEERVMASLIIFYDGIDSIEDIAKLPDTNLAAKEMIKFFNCGQEESPGMKVNYKLIDWNADSLLICSAINKVANTEIRALPYLHWWTFMGYYLAIGESALSSVVNIRNKIAKGKKLEKHEQEFKRTNPQYFHWDSKTTAQKDADELAKQLWNSGK